jgi:hypothetical protein
MREAICPIADSGAVPSGEGPELPTATFAGNQYEVRRRKLVGPADCNRTCSRQKLAHLRRLRRCSDCISFLRNYFRADEPLSAES